MIILCINNAYKALFGSNSQLQMLLTMYNYETLLQGQIQEGLESLDLVTYLLNISQGIHGQTELLV